jgi:hypothetical protein
MRTDNGLLPMNDFHLCQNETIGLGSILFLVCAFLMWLYHFVAVTQHIYQTTDTTTESL